MRKVISVSGLLCLALVACNSTPKSDPGVILPSTSPPTAPPSGDGVQVVSTFEGTFDATTRKLTISYRDPNTGQLVAESTIPEGTAPGEAFLHTEGTSNDHLSDPPAWNPATHVLTATVDGENGLTGTITGFTANLTFTPASSTGMILNGTTTCQGASLGSGAKAGPCAVAYGNVAVDPSFPTPVFTFPETWSILALSGNFSFSGTITGTPQTVAGSVTFATPGTTTWTVPAGVTSVSVVSVGAGGGGTNGAKNGGGGGGALCYANNVAVTPGQQITVVVGSGGGNGIAGGASSFNGAVIANGGGGANPSTSVGGAGGTGNGGTCFSGGNGGSFLGSGSNLSAGGGGAAGYAGNGGNGSDTAGLSCPNDATAGAGGGGGGGGAAGG